MKYLELLCRKILKIWHREFGHQYGCVFAYIIQKIVSKILFRVTKTTLPWLERRTATNGDYRIYQSFPLKMLQSLGNQLLKMSQTLNR